MSSKKRKHSQRDVSSASESEDVSSPESSPVKSKKLKKEKPSKKKPVVESSSDSEDDDSNKKRETKTKSKASSSSEDAPAFIDLGSKRRVTVSEFYGKTMIDIREFYEKHGEHLPGKKGISLSLAQWNELKQKIERVDKMIEAVEKKSK